MHCATSPSTNAVVSDSAANAPSTVDTVNTTNGYLMFLGHVKNDGNTVNDCRKACPLACKDYSYTVDVSTTDWPLIPRTLAENYTLGLQQRQDTRRLSLMRRYVDRMARDTTPDVNQDQEVPFRYIFALRIDILS
jgi:hypothetical protein